MFHCRLITKTWWMLSYRKKFSDGYSSMPCSATFAQWESVTGKRSLHCNWTQHTMQHPCFVTLSAWSLWRARFSGRTPFHIWIFLFMPLKRMVHWHWPTNGFTHFISNLNHSVPSLQATQVTKSTQCRLWISPGMVYAFFFQHHHHSILIATSNTFTLRKSFIVP